MSENLGLQNGTLAISDYVTVSLLTYTFLFAISYHRKNLFLSAVSSMKDAGTWPTIDYKKCTEYNQQDPLVQNVNLLQSMKSISVISFIF